MIKVHLYGYIASLKDSMCAYIKSAHKWHFTLNDMAIEGSIVGDDASANKSDWIPPEVDHIILPLDSTPATPRHYPNRQRQPADRYQS